MIALRAKPMALCDPGTWSMSYLEARPKTIGISVLGAASTTMPRKENKVEI